jgi:hypothetical protein
MRHKTAALALAGCLTIVLLFGSLSSAAPLVSKTKISHLKFSGPVSEADQKYLGLGKAGDFSLQDIKAPYVLIEITRTT